MITGSSGQERIYGGYPDIALDLISSRTLDGRIQLLKSVSSGIRGVAWVARERHPGALCPNVNGVTQSGTTQR